VPLKVTLVVPVGSVPRIVTAAPTAPDVVCIIHELFEIHRQAEDRPHVVGLSLNVKAPYFLVAELAPLMAKRGKGAIVNLSTMVADYGAPGMSLYGSSKAAINLLTKNLGG
jgi:short-subunit dehydrogenase involved in D-alanine esterification of teichoic acids